MYDGETTELQRTLRLRCAALIAVVTLVVTILVVPGVYVIAL